MKCRGTKNTPCKKEAKAKYLFLWCGIHVPLGEPFWTLFWWFISTIAGGIVTYFVVDRVIDNRQPFTATISIKDWKGRDDRKINESNGTIKILDKTAKSITTGSVEFGEIPAKHKNKAIKVEFFPCEDCTGWDLLHDTIVLQPKQSSELRIKIKGLEQIYGTVTDENENPIDSAKIEIIGSQPLLYTYTNKGKYKIEIPIPQQEYYQQVRVSKPNFKDGNKCPYLENNTNSIDFKLKPAKHYE
jgi:hypothetical protein